MKPVSILLVDDHQLVIDGLRNLLTEYAGVEIVGEANDGKRAIAISESIHVDIILMDIDMPVMGGLEATTRLKKDKPDTKIIILTMHDEPSIIQKVMNIGADGYLLKNSDKEELFSAIQKVSNGQKYFSSDVALSLMEKRKKGNGVTPDAARLAELTSREIEIIKLIAEGYSNKEIGEKLFISHRTVDTHRTNLMRKLEVRNIAGLVKFAFQNGLTE